MDSLVVSSICYLLFYRKTPMIRNYLRYVFSAVFLLSALVKAFDFKETALFFFSLTGFSLVLVKVFLSGLILLEISIAWLVYLKIYNNNYIYRLILLLLGLCLIFSLVLFVLNAGNCGCFGTRIISTPVMSISKNILLILIFYYMGKRGRQMLEGRASSL